MRKLLTLATLLVSSSFSFSQISQVGNPIDRGPLLPAACNVGQIYFQTTAAGSGIGLYACTSTNTWVLVGSGAGGTVTAVTATVPILSSGGTTPDISVEPDPVFVGTVGASSFAAGPSPPTACDGTNGNVCATEDASQGVPTAGVDILQADPTNHLWLQSLNGAAYVPVPNAVTSPLSMDATGNISCPTCGSSSGGGVLTKTASYLIDNADSGKLIYANCPSACTMTLPASPTGTFKINIMSVGSTVAALSLNSLTFNGGASAPVLNTYRTIAVWSDGSNYQGQAALVAGTNITFTAASNGVTVSTVPNFASYTVTGGTSGGVPYFSSTSTMGTSAVLSAGQLVAGGGGGNPPVNSGIFGSSSGISAASTAAWKVGNTGGTATGNTGTITVEPVSITGAASSVTAGSLNLYGADNANTNAGTETAGDLTAYAGQVTSATPATKQNGRTSIGLTGIKGSSTTAGLAQCVTASAPTAGYPGTYGDCASAGVNEPWIGVGIGANGASTRVQQIGNALVLSSGSESWTAGQHVCLDATNNAYFTNATGGATRCAYGLEAGVASFTDLSGSTTHYMIIIR